MSTTNELLQEGIQAAKSGQVDKAHRILKQVVEREPRNEMAWLWLSGVLETDEQRMACLENVLAINPHHEAARRGLQALRQKVVTIKPLPKTAAQPKEMVTKPPKKWYQQRWFLLLAFLFLTPLWALIILTDRNQGAGVKILAAILLAVAIIVICPSLAKELISSTLTPTTYQVTYQVTGSAQRASVVYWTADGMEQRTIDLPWKRTFKTQEHQIISVVAQNEGDAGSIKCEILINGKVTKTATSTGAYSLVTCGP